MADSNRPQGKRERVDTTPGKAGGSRFIRRDERGRFTSYQVDSGRAIAADRRGDAKRTEGDERSRRLAGRDSRV